MDKITASLHERRHFEGEVLEDRHFVFREEQLQRCNVFPLISGGKVALNRGSGRRRFNATFSPILRGKRYQKKKPECDLLYSARR